MTRLTLRDVPGLRVGHWTDATGLTGCTVVLAPDDGRGRRRRRARLGAGHSRDRSPAPDRPRRADPRDLPRRWLGLRARGRRRRHAPALAERGIGFATGVRPVPIVPAAILFDLGVGDPLAVPDADAGYAATLAAEENDGPLEGRIGAGTGATVAKMAGPEQRAARRGRKRRAAPPRRLDRRRAGREQRARRHPCPRRNAARARDRRASAAGRRQHDARRRRDRCEPRPRPMPQACRARPRCAGDRDPPDAHACSMATSSSR